jgi:hypothetical protein
VAWRVLAVACPVLAPSLRTAKEELAELDIGAMVSAALSAAQEPLAALAAVALGSAISRRE